MSTTNPHILTSFNDALVALRADVLMMASLARRNLEQAVRGLFERDGDLCNQTIADDEEVDQLEKSIDARGIEILLRFQPLATDLRHVVSAMKVVTNLERVSDKAVNIARKARKVNASAEVPEAQWLRPLADKASSLYRKSIQAFEQGDAELAGTIRGEDRGIDAEHDRVTERLMEQLSQRSDQPEALVGLIFICRHFERVGDLSKNIAEDVVFAEAAEDIRHRARPPESAGGTAG